MLAFQLTQTQSPSRLDAQREHRERNPQHVVDMLSQCCMNWHKAAYASLVCFFVVGRCASPATVFCSEAAADGRPRVLVLVISRNSSDADFATAAKRSSSGRSTCDIADTAARNTRSDTCPIGRVGQVGYRNSSTTSTLSTVCTLVLTYFVLCYDACSPAQWAPRTIAV